MSRLPCLCRVGILFALLISWPALTPAGAGQEKKPAKANPASILGRWDIVVRTPQGEYPSWLEVRLSGYRTLVGSFVGQFGSARPISRVDFADGRIQFTVPPQWERHTDDLRFE